MDFFEFSNPGDLVKNIRAMVRCPFCGSEYIEKNIKVVGRMEKNHVLQLLCQECSHTIMANIAYKKGPRKKSGDIQEQIVSAELQEMTEFPQKDPISNDDVMDFFKTMRDFDGDFKRLFTNKASKRFNK